MNQATTPPVAAKKESKAKSNKEPTVRRSKFAELYPEDAKLTIICDTNPKKAGSKSFARFEGYTGADTVGAALAKGVTYQDIAYDIGRQFVKVG